MYLVLLLAEYTPVRLLDLHYTCKILAELTFELEHEVSRRALVAQVLQRSDCGCDPQEGGQTGQRTGCPALRALNFHAFTPFNGPHTGYFRRAAARVLGMDVWSGDTFLRTVREGQRVLVQ